MGTIGSGEGDGVSARGGGSSGPDAWARLGLMRSVLEHANDAVLVTEVAPIDEPGPKIVYANPAFSRTTGYSG